MARRARKTSAVTFVCGGWLLPAGTGGWTRTTTMTGGCLSFDRQLKKFFSADILAAARIFTLNVSLCDA
jgi:hypothetical protein